METVEISVMSKVEPPDDLPNGDDSAFVSEVHHQQNHEEDVDEHHPSDEDDDEEDDIHHPDAVSLPHTVFMSTPHGLLTPVTAEQLHEAGIKTTHIVIHDETLGDSVNDQPTTPLPPPTPATPLSKERGFRYTWDESAYNPEIPVRCKNSNGVLHKCRFGSGGRGRCIKMGSSWYTPSEFEAVCGRASSKDWKRSIRYGGRTLACLIEDGILQPHATSCTCAACCDDEAVTGPVRLFVPYKRRKRESGEIVLRKKSFSSKPTLSLSPSPNKETAIVTLSAGQSLRMSSSEGSVTENIQILATSDATTSILQDQTLIIAPQTPTKPTACVSVVSDQKVWWQLEEMANNLIQQAQQLKALIEQAKQQGQAITDSNFQQFRSQLEKEKNEALNAVRIEAQMQMSRAIIEERAQKDIAVQQALAQARVEMQGKMDSTLAHVATRNDLPENTVTVTDDKNTVVYLWPAQHSADLMDTTEGTESDKDRD